MKEKKWLWIVLFILLGSCVALFAVLFFVNGNVQFMFASLLCIGMINVVNGIVFMQRASKSVGAIFLVGGVALMLFMVVVLFLR